MDKSKFIPSMFHRRLLVVLAGMAAITTLLGAQLFRLTVFEGKEHLRDAESKLSQRTYLPTYRGRILDRSGNILALDRPSYDVAMRYEVMTGRWVESKARLDAQRAVGSDVWREMTADQQRQESDPRRPIWEAKVEQLRHLYVSFGEIEYAELDRRCNEIITRVSREAERYRTRRRQELDITDDRPLPYREERASHVILPRVPDAVAYEFRRFALDNPGMIDVPYTLSRQYPWQESKVFFERSSLPTPIRSEGVQELHLVGIADHLVGSVRDEVWEEDVKRRPFIRSDRTTDLGGYRDGDTVGSRGLERAYEDHLRGMRGTVEEDLETGERAETAPTPGSDLGTSLDIELQTRIQAILHPDLGLARVNQWQLGWDLGGRPRSARLPLGTPLNSAAVVLEVETGEILALVSMPTMAMGEGMSEAQRKLATPVINRAYEAVYPPGSIIKPLVLSAAMTEGKYAVGDEIECVGHFFEHSQNFARCWIYREAYGFNTHGMLAAEEAIGRSCNIFFYTLADRLGMESLTDWLRRFGLGSALDIGLLPRDEFEERYRVWHSQVPSDEQISQLRMRGEYDSATVFMGIGQGPITWTPLHAANAFATFARGGIVRDATLVPEVRGDGNPARRADLNLSRDTVRVALEGLRQSVMELYGTGHHILYPEGQYEPIINAEAVTVWAKTGTAQAPPLRRDLNGDGKSEEHEFIEDLDHAWFVGLVGPENAEPLYAISVIVEYGGSGGRTAGPIANQIIRALQARHYLPGDPAAPPKGMP
jgi:penicillin-binding protein 2